jgi:hypothetical protein
MERRDSQFEIFNSEKKISIHIKTKKKLKRKKT